MPSAPLDVVIVSYRCESLLRDCLARCARTRPRGPMRVHVVDNASGDGDAGDGRGASSPRSS